jgi:hypothetical protein
MQDAYELPRIHESGSSTSENTVKAKFALPHSLDRMGSGRSKEEDNGPLQAVPVSPQPLAVQRLCCYRVT